MVSLKSTVIFVAGMEFFHTISHIFLYCFVALPMDVGSITLTPTLNGWAIVANGVITLLLLWWAKRLS